MSWGYMLACPEGERDLDGYLFTDWAHAKSWMRQACIVGGGYRVFAVLYKRRKCCGEPYAIRRGAVLLGTRKGKHGRSAAH